MEDFVLLFHQPDIDDSNVSAIEKKAVFEKWDGWFAEIVVQAKLNNMDFA